MQESVRETYSASKQHTIMPILNLQPLCCLILLIPYPSNSKSFSPPQANAIALHYPTNTHDILPIYYTAPSHNPCIFDISNSMLLLILVKITYLLQAQILHTQHHIQCGTYSLEYDGFSGWNKLLVEGRKFIPCNTFKRETYSASKQDTIMPILNSQLLCGLILLTVPSTHKFTLARACIRVERESRASQLASAISPRYARCCERHSNTYLRHTYR